MAEKGVLGERFYREGRADIKNEKEKTGGVMKRNRMVIFLIAGAAKTSR
jgi:hypothetical protein